MRFLKILFAVLILLAVSFPKIYAAQELDVSAKAAVLIVADTKEILYSENKDLKLSMASTTKIMTSLLALESGKQKNIITVQAEDIAVEGTSMGLLAGDKVTLEALVYGMLLQSGNDAANVTAKFLSDKVDFAVQMNLKAAELGMKNTSFVTPSGLDDENHYSTAYDMALLAREAIKNPEFRFICSQKTAFCTYGNPPYRRMLTNHNRLLNEIEGCIGIKTGFTKKSGRCLVSAVERNGVTLIAVTLNAPDDWNDHKKLYEYGFSKINEFSDLKLSSLNVVGGTKNSVALEYPEPGISAADEKKLTTKYLIKHFEYAPVKKGQIVGTVRYYYDGALIKSAPIIAAEDVKIKATPENY